MSAIGCHAQHLACFVTGRGVARVSAEVGTVVPGRRIIDHVSALVEFDGGCKGTFTAFQAAAGARERHPAARLRRARHGGLVAPRVQLPAAVDPRGAGARDRPRRPGPAARDHQGGPVAARAPGGPAAGVREHLRRGGAGAHGARPRRRAAGVSSIPRIEDGVHTMAFIEACLASHAAGRWVSYVESSRRSRDMASCDRREFLACVAAGVAASAVDGGAAAIGARAGCA